jgi:hypothetical protein
MSLLKGLYELLIVKPRKVRVAKKYFKDRFGPAFFMKPAYCADCDKKPIQHTITAQEAEQSVNRSMATGMPEARLEVGSTIPVCPECNWWMDVSSWDRFRAGFKDNSFTVEEFEKMEKKSYSNSNFVTETLNQKN